MISGYLYVKKPPVHARSAATRPHGSGQVVVAKPRSHPGSTRPGLDPVVRSRCFGKPGVVNR